MATDVTSPVDRLSAVEASILGFTTAEKLELIERIARSIRAEAAVQWGPSDPAERVEWQHQNRMKLLAEIVALADDPEEQARVQRENLDRMIRRLEELPAIPHDDGLTNRDHDKILYGSPS